MRKVTLLENRDALAERAKEIPGAIAFDYAYDSGEVPEGEGNYIIGMHFVCPCGCGHIGYLNLKKKEGSEPAWTWNDDVQAPTMTPSVNFRNEHWHGYLTDGIWKSVTEPNEP